MNVDRAQVAARGFHHVGLTVDNMEVALTFWTSFLQTETEWSKRITGRHLGEITGYPGAEINGAWIRLGDSYYLELVEYIVEEQERSPVPAGTAHIGSSHVAIRVDDIDHEWSRAVSLGAVAISPGPIEIKDGPNAGARGCYLSAPGGGVMELTQLPPG